MKRLDHFFDAGYYLAGNEPSFQTPLEYHYAGLPGKSVDRVRQGMFRRCSANLSSQLVWSAWKLMHGFNNLLRILTFLTALPAVCDYLAPLVS